MTVNTKIRKLRENLGLTQQQFGDLLGGVSKQTISRWETEGKPIPYDKRLLIAEKLNVSPTVIFDDEVISGFVATSDDELIESIKENYYKLSPDKRLEVLKLIIGQ